ncbi:MAG: MBL fold metallo-hydrolase [Methyloligellaceae bacterium]
MQASGLSAKCIAPTGARQTRFGETPRFDEGLYDLGGGVYAWMVPNGSWGESNAGLVVGAEESLLIDTLWDVRATRDMLEAMLSVMGQTMLTTVVNTHADGDHFWGNQLVAKAKIITSAASREEMDHHKPAAMAKFAQVGRLASALPFPDAQKIGHWFQAMCAPYAFDEVVHTPANLTFTGHQSLELSGRKVRLIEVGPAHTQGDLMVHIPDLGILFAGDILFIGSTPVMWAGPVENWLKALDLILELDVDTIVPGHGPLTDREGVKQVIAYWELTVREARKRFDSGIPPVEAACGIVSSPAFRESPFTEWDSPERMMTNVHVLYRHFRGNTRPLSTLQVVNILRKQALLAHAFPEGRPASMRFGG